MSLVIDRVVGWVFGEPGLIYPPGAVAQYRSFEYNFVAEINKLGFRDRDYPAPSKEICRIAVLGDSFTYGWGVELSQCWVKVLERNLARQGLAVEVANLGKPGADPAYYAGLAAKAIPVLRPRVVLVAVLQGDDLISLGYPKPSQSVWARLGTFLYPHTLMRPRRSRTVISEAATRQEYQKAAAEIISVIQGETRERYEQLDEFVKQVFIRGDLNPAAINIALKYPDYFEAPLRLESPQVSGLIKVMGKHFHTIGEIARDYGASTIIVSVPNDIYVSEINLKNRAKMGYKVTEEMLTTQSPDLAIEEAARRAGLPVVTVTSKFRAAARQSQLFFPYDGHFNAAGHQVFGDLVTPLVAQFLPSLPGIRAATLP